VAVADAATVSAVVSGGVDNGVVNDRGTEHLSLWDRLYVCCSAPQ